MNSSRFKPVIWVLPLLISTAICITTPSNAVTVQSVPNPRQTDGKWVTDMAQMLSPQAKAQINQMITALESENGTEIAVVTVPDTAPSATPKVFATELFNTWGIGKKGRNNGVLLLISKSDRRVEIETGYGVENILPDAKVGEITSTQIIPYFKRSDFEQGILTGTTALVQTLRQDAPAHFIDLSPYYRWMGTGLTSLGLTVIWCGGLLIIIMRPAKLARSTYRPAQFRTSSRSSYGTSYSTSDQHSDDSSGGSGDFGGGESGGGGDGDSW